MLDIVDDTLAIAKVEVSFSKSDFIDYLVLYKVGNDWRIMTKTFVLALPSNQIRPNRSGTYGLGSGIATSLIISYILNDAPK